MPTYLEMEQGSPEWHEARRGRITASNCERLFGRPDTRMKYLRQVAAERLVTEPVDKFKGNYWTERGHALENEARNALAFDTGLNITQTGICISDISPWFTCSPDGLAENKTIVQIKCPAPSTHIEYVINPDLLIDAYEHQLHAELVATASERAIIVSYCPGMRLVTREVTLTDLQRENFTKIVLFALAEIEIIIEQVKL